MRRIGYSDKVFYYNGSGPVGTFNFRMRLRLKQRIDPKKVQEAANIAIRLFPEYAVRPVVCDNKLYYEENNAPVAVFPEDGKRHNLGTDETNGYLFCFLYRENEILLSYFHGLSDFVGNWSLICTFLYHYGKLVGHDEEPCAPVRFSARDYYDIEETDREDPYFKYLTPEDPDYQEPRYGNALRIAEDDDLMERMKLHCFELEYDLQAFLKKKEELHTSFIPLLAAVISENIAAHYPEDHAPVVTKIPVNLRPLYGSRTTANFSDSMILTLDDEMKGKELGEICSRFKQMEREQIRKENFDDKIRKKVNTVIGYENSGEAIEEINERLVRQVDGGSRPITYALTYPGSLVVPDCLAELVQDFNMEPYLPTGGTYITAGAYEDRICLRFHQAFDSDEIVRCVSEGMKQLGIHAVYRDCGYVMGDRVCVEQFKHISKENLKLC